MSGDFDPARWKLYRVAGKDAGVLLVNAHPDQAAWEVVYVGVAHDCRGLRTGSPHGDATHCPPARRRAVGAFAGGR